MIHPAATIMLARDHEGQLEVLLLKRNKALAFAGGAWVFPGGKIEAEEMDAGTDELAAAKIAAVRETKEEAALEIKEEKLIYFRHWTTPDNEPRRFSTWFFFGGIDDPDSEVKIDDSEIKEHIWINPQKALEKLKKGALMLLPPTFLCLQAIRQCQSVAEVEAKLRREAPIRVLPVVSMQPGEITILYRGDAGYETRETQINGPRHRLVMAPGRKEIIFEYEGCDEILPVNGGDTFFS